MITSCTSLIPGSLNIVFNSKASIIDLNPLAPVFLFIAFLAISEIASSLKINFAFSNSKKAINKKTGARGLRSIIEALLLKTMFKLPTMDDIQEVVVNASVVKNNSEPILTHSKTKKTSAA